MARWCAILLQSIQLFGVNGIQPTAMTCLFSSSPPHSLSDY